MKQLLAVAVLFALAPPVNAGEGGPEPGSHSIENVQWMAGCWENVREGFSMEEQWMKPGGRAMLGVNRSVRGDRMVAYEFLRIEEREGILHLIPKPSGQAEATFRAVEVQESSVLFENPDHDFPQRIGYRLQEDGSLLGWIEGVKDGKPRRVGFPMQRAKCR